MGGITGVSSTDPYNDIWKYDPGTKLWTWIKGANVPNNVGFTGTQGVESANSLPSARASFNYWVVGNYLYVYSGDLWKYSFATNNWTYLGGTMSQNPSNNSTGPPVYGQIGVEATANNPANRAGATCWSDGNYLYLFGGMINSEVSNDLWRYNLTTNKWAWIKGINYFVSVGSYYGVEGNIGIEDPANRPSVRTGAICNKIGSIVYMIGGTNGLSSSSIGDIWRYNIQTNNWAKLHNPPANTPNFGIFNTYAGSTSPGSCVANLWSDGGSIFSFGGTKSNGMGDYDNYNAVWQFDTSLLQWRWINNSNMPSPKGVYNYRNVSVSSSHPGGRSNSIQWELNNEIYLLGGSGTAGVDNGLLADFWKYNKSTKNWTWLGGSDNHALNGSGYTENAFTDVSYQTGIPNINNRPAIGSYAASWSVNDDVYVFGKVYSAADASYYTLPSCDQIWKYSNSNNNWTLMRPATSATTIPPVYGILNIADSLNTPGTRAGEAYWVYNNKLYLFGGQSHHYFTWSNELADSLMNDLWEYDLATKKWRWIKGDNICTKNGTYGTVGIAAAANTPGGRMDPQFWQANNKFYLMGGRGKGESGSGIGYLNDLWEYDPSTNNWRWIKGGKLISKPGTFGTKGVANTANTPGGRINGVCWATNNKLYTFMGRGIEPANGAGNYSTDPILLNELWAYDINTNNWTWLKGSNDFYQYSIEYYANYGTKGVASSTVRPYASSGATGTVVNGKLYLYGGTSNYAYVGGCNACGGARNDLWEYDPSTNFWKWVEGTGAAAITASYPDTPVAPLHIWPGVINNSVANLSWAYNQKFHIFGGTVYGSNNEIWGYNLCQNPSVCNATLPQVSLGNDTNICIGNPKELNAGNFGSSYLWSTGDTTQAIVAIQSGSYWVKVTNPANLIASDTITVTFAASPVVPFGGNVTMCAGQTYTLNALNPGCAYLWNTGSTDSAIVVDTTGIYAVNIVNAYGCSAQASMNIVQTPLPIADLGPDTGECSPSPGWPQHAISVNYAPDQHYLWNTGDTTEVIFVTQSGTYNIQVTNEYGCIAYDTILITYDTPVVFSLGNDTSICPNIPLTLNAAYVNCSYLWSDNSTDSFLNVTQQGNYSLFLTTQFGCQTFDDINISVLPLPQATSIQSQVNGDTVHFAVNNAQNVNGYFWIFDDNMTGSGSGPTHVYSQNGSYNVKLVITNDCGSDTLSKVVLIQTSQPNGINDMDKNLNIKVFPNPANETLYLQSEIEKIKRVTILNALGQKVFDSGNINDRNVKLNIKGISQGMYQLKLEAASGYHTTKLVITR